MKLTVELLRRDAKVLTIENVEHVHYDHNGQLTVYYYQDALHALQPKSFLIGDFHRSDSILCFGVYNGDNQNKG